MILRPVWRLITQIVLFLLLLPAASSAQCVSGAEVTTYSGKRIVQQNLGDDPQIRVTTGRRPGTPIAYIVTDERNTILKWSIDETIDLSGISECKIRVWAISFAGRVTAETGELVDRARLASICYALSDNFVEIENTGERACQTPNAILVKDADLQPNNSYTWTRDNVYLLDGIVVLEEGATLIIQARYRHQGKN